MDRISSDNTNYNNLKNNLNVGGKVVASFGGRRFTIEHKKKGLISKLVSKILQKPAEQSSLVISSSLIGRVSVEQKEKLLSIALFTLTGKDQSKEKENSRLGEAQGMMPRKAAWHSEKGKEFLKVFNECVKKGKISDKSGTGKISRNLKAQSDLCKPGSYDKMCFKIASLPEKDRIKLKKRLDAHRDTQVDFLNFRRNNNRFN